MSRKPRLFVPGGLYHVMLRGNGGQNIFNDDQDRHHIYKLFQDGVKRFEHRIIAFCLMDNHIHLAIQVGTIPLSKIIQNISFRYTRYFNKKQNRMGHLFQGRYKALLVSKDLYFLSLIRYIHNNPLRANLVKKLSDYKWSSHLSYLDQNGLNWLDRDFGLSFFGKDRKLAVKEYCSFMMEEENEVQVFQIGVYNSRIIGDETFAEESLLLANQKSERNLEFNDILEIICLEYGIKMDDLKEKRRNRKLSYFRYLIAALSVDYNASSLNEVALFFGRDISTLSNGIKRHFQRDGKNIYPKEVQLIINKQIRKA